jgi:hypothetical protein
MEDPVGMGLVVDMELKILLAKGRIKTHVQFDTLCKLRSTYAKNYTSSPEGVAKGSLFAQGTGRVYPTSCPSQSEWIQDALWGMEYCMGYDSQADHGVAIKAIVDCLDRIKWDADQADSVEDANQLWKICALICMVTLGSLQGYKGL